MSPTGRQLLPSHSRARVRGSSPLAWLPDHREFPGHPSAVTPNLNNEHFSQARSSSQAAYYQGNETTAIAPTGKLGLRRY